MEELDKKYKENVEKDENMSLFLGMLAEMTGDKLFTIQLKKKEIMRKIDEVTIGSREMKEMEPDYLTSEQKEKVVNVLDQFIQVLDDLNKEFKGE